MYILSMICVKFIIWVIVEFVFDFVKDFLHLLHNIIFDKCILVLYSITKLTSYNI